MPPSYRLRYSPKARQDFEAIISYSAATGGEQRMKTYIKMLSEALTDLTRFPGLGRARDDIAFGLRSYPVGQHLALYRVTDREVFIVRLLHGSQDVDQQIDE